MSSLINAILMPHECCWQTVATPEIKSAHWSGMFLGKSPCEQKWLESLAHAHSSGCICSRGRASRNYPAGAMKINGNKIRTRRRLCAAMRPLLPRSCIIPYASNLSLSQSTASFKLFIFILCSASPMQEAKNEIFFFLRRSWVLRHKYSSTSWSLEWMLGLERVHYPSLFDLSRAHCSPQG